MEVGKIRIKKYPKENGYRIERKGKDEKIRFKQGQKLSKRSKSNNYINFNNFWVRFCCAGFMNIINVLIIKQSLSKGKNNVSRFLMLAKVESSCKKLIIRKI